LKPVVFILGPSALQMAERIADNIDGEVHGPMHVAALVQYEQATGHIAKLFRDGRAIVGICAAGILIRALTSVVRDKTEEPAVVAVSEDGKSVVPLLGGHHGANALARQIAKVTDGHAAITTASDVMLGIALDEPPAGYTISNANVVKSVVSRMLSGERLKASSDAPWLSLVAEEDGSIPVKVEIHRGDDDGVLLFHPARLVVGVGCERGTPETEIRTLINETLALHNISPEAVSHYATLDLKEDDPGIVALGKVRYFTHHELNAESHRVIRPSEIVKAEVGTPSVAEAAALAAAGPDARLIVPKTKSARATCAIAEAPAPILELRGKAGGSLSVIGLGPGSPDLRAPDATHKLKVATDWVGYDLYLDLAMDAHQGQTLHKFPLGGEEDRVRHAIELAKRGKRVALVCSGDAGIYAMAALVYEMLDFDRCRIAVEVVPGISAFQLAAARVGGLIGHDFCAISLSDLMTPWQVIERRVHAAAQGDFVVAFYNPRSKARSEHLVEAMKILAAHRKPETPVVIARNLGRPDESVTIVPFSEFDHAQVDMLTVVLVGSSQSVAFKRSDGRTYAYTPRGYIERGRT
jgi:cobalt-precorrin 5A hydrolase / precorrin-3B C17-methyltransferase